MLCWHPPPFVVPPKTTTFLTLYLGSKVTQFHVPVGVLFRTYKRKICKRENLIKISELVNEERRGK